MGRAVLLAVICVSAVMGASGSAGAVIQPPLMASPGYRFVTVDHPAAVGQTYLTSIVSDGTAVGAYTDGAGVTHGMVRKPNGVLRTVDVPNAAQTYLTGINDSGMLAGTFADAAGAQHGFVRSRDGSFRQIDVPGADPTTTAISEFGTGLGTSVATIDADGTVVGDWGDSEGASHGFVLRRHGQRVDLDAPGATTAQDPVFGFEGGTVAIRENARGQVVGSYSPDPRMALGALDLRGVLKTGPRWTTLLPADADTSQAFAITNNGEVGGVAFDADGLNGYGWLWRNGRFTRIDAAPQAFFSTVADITSSGVLVGEYLSPDFQVHGYIATPTHH
jgi:hypothetical protein